MYKTAFLVLFSIVPFGCGAAEAPLEASVQPTTNSNMVKPKRKTRKTAEAAPRGDEQTAKAKQSEANSIPAKDLPADLRALIWNDFIEPYENARVVIEEKDLNHDGANEYLIYIADEGDGQIIPPHQRDFWIVGKQNGAAVSLVPVQLSANKLRFIRRGAQEFDDIEFVGSDVEDFGTGDTTKSDAKDYIHTYRMFDNKYYWCAAREEKSGKPVDIKNFSAAFKQNAHPSGKSCADRETQTNADTKRKD